MTLMCCELLQQKINSFLRGMKIIKTRSYGNIILSKLEQRENPKTGKRHNLLLKMKKKTILLFFFVFVYEQWHYPCDAIRTGYKKKPKCMDNHFNVSTLTMAPQNNNIYVIETCKLWSAFMNDNKNLGRSECLEPCL